MKLCILAKYVRLRKGNFFSPVCLSTWGSTCDKLHGTFHLLQPLCPYHTDLFKLVQLWPPCPHPNLLRLKVSPLVYSTKIKQNIFHTQKYVRSDKFLAVFTSPFYQQVPICVISLEYILTRKNITAALFKRRVIYSFSSDKVLSARYRNKFNLQVHRTGQQIIL